MLLSAIRRKPGKTVRAFQTRIIRKAAIEALERRVLMTGLPDGVSASVGATYDYESGAHTLSLTAGTLTFNADVGSPSSLALDVSADGSGSNLIFNTSEHLDSLTLKNGAKAQIAQSGTYTTESGAISDYGTSLVQADSKVLVLNGLSIPVVGGTNSAQGTLDLTNNAMMLNYTGSSATALSAADAVVASGCDDCVWDGTGVTSSEAEVDANGNGYFAVGTADNSDLEYSTFAGQDVSSYSQILFSFTYYGSSTLDGKVSNGDLLSFEAGRPSNPGGPAGTGWEYGEYDYGASPQGSNGDLLLFENGQSGYELLSSVYNGGSYAAPVDAPSSLSAGHVSSNSIELFWTNNSTSATDNIILRSTEDGPFEAVAWTVPGSSTSYTDDGLTAGTNYVYEVKAVGDTSVSAPSNMASETTIPPTPTGLTATVESQSEIDLTWDVTSGANGYYVQRDGGGGWLDVAKMTDQSSTTYQDFGLWDGTTYNYRVAAYNDAGTSDWTSDDVGATTLTTAPTAPSIAAVRVSDTEAYIVWTDTAHNADLIEIDRQEQGVTGWTVVTEEAPNVCSFDDPGLDSTKTYVYRAIALNVADDTESSASFACVPALGANSAYTVNHIQGMQYAVETDADGYLVEGFFAVTRKGDISSSATIDFSIDSSALDSATLGYEYSDLGFPGTASFGDGQRTAVVEVVPNEIDHPEGPKSLTLVIPTGVGTDTTSTSINIINTDGATISHINPIKETVGVETDLAIEVTNAWDRPYVGSLSYSGFDTGILDMSSSSSTGADGITLVTSDGVSNGSTDITATTEHNATSTFGVTVYNQSLQFVYRGGPTVPGGDVNPGIAPQPWTNVDIEGLDMGPTVPVELALKLTDANGNAIVDQNVQMTSSDGSYIAGDEQVTDAAGVAIFSIANIKTSDTGTRELTLTFTSESDPTATQTITVDIHFS